MKYFRTYPWGLQLLLFLVMVFTMMGFGTVMVLTFLPKFSPYGVEQLGKINEHSPAQLVYTALTVQGILSACIFLIPAWLFSYLTHPEPGQYLGLRKPGKHIQFVLAILLMLGAMPILQVLQSLIGQIDFGPKVKAAQAANDSASSAYLNIPTFGAFVRAFVILAIIPALGEEMFFRGVLLRFSRRFSRNMVLPILFTAVIFSYSHTNAYGFLSIVFAGILLAVIYNLTGSLWCSILAHMFFNGSQVILSYLGNSNAAVKAFINGNEVPTLYIISGVILFVVSLYLLLKNKTPLPENWTDDFPPDAPKEDDWDFIKNNQDQ